MKNIEILGALKVIEDDGKINIINEGDDITCFINDNEYYIGTLSKIGYCQKNKNATKPAIEIICKKDKVISYNVVMLSDIKWVHKMSEKEKRELEELISNIK